MAVWTVARVACECGYCATTVAAEAPFALVCGKVRCVACAGRAGYQLDDAAVDRARQQLEADRARETFEQAHATPAGSRQRTLGFTPLTSVADEVDRRLPSGDRE